MMHITIIIDKSTFQALSYKELYHLTNYYLHNVTPVLTMEILGDLSKESKEGRPPSEVRVKDFATKLFPKDTIINVHYKELVKGELLGHSVEPDGRPFVRVEKPIEASDGKVGNLVSETKEERSIYKWREGNFSEADRELSELWRTTTTQEDLLKNLQTALREAQGTIVLDSFSKLNDLVESKLNSPEGQDKLLAYLIDNYSIEPTFGSLIFERWYKLNRPLIKDFAPYANYCLKSDLLFLCGLNSGLITVRPTNRVDIEYLYYLPFCNVFTSNDKIHRNIVQYLLKPYQTFVWGEDLKGDFKNIVDYLDAGGEEIKKKFNHEPPIIEDSITFQLWKKYFGYPQTSNINRNISEEELEKMKNQIRIFQEAIKNGKEVYDANGKKMTFIVKNSYMTMNDPCFCGSGKKVIDCCKEKFIKMAEQERKEKS